MMIQVENVFLDEKDIVAVEYEKLCLFTEEKFGIVLCTVHGNRHVCGIYSREEVEKRCREIALYLFGGDFVRF